MHVYFSLQRTVYTSLTLRPLRETLKILYSTWIFPTVEFAVNEGQFRGYLEMIYTSYRSRGPLLLLPLLLRLGALPTGPFNFRPLHHLLLEHLELLALLLAPVELLRHNSAPLHRHIASSLAVAAINRLQEYGASADVEETTSGQEATGVSE